MYFSDRFYIRMILHAFIFYKVYDEAGFFTVTALFLILLYNERMRYIFFMFNKALKKGDL